MDLLSELIDACYPLGIKVIACFDFYKTDDYVCQERPERFVREPNGSPHSYGFLRPGCWSILYWTCINSGYRNEEVAGVVLRGDWQISFWLLLLNAPIYGQSTLKFTIFPEKGMGKPLGSLPTEYVSNIHNSGTPMARGKNTTDFRGCYYSSWVRKIPCSACWIGCTTRWWKRRCQ